MDISVFHKIKPYLIKLLLIRQILSKLAIMFELASWRKMAAQFGAKGNFLAPISIFWKGAACFMVLSYISIWTTITSKLKYVKRRWQNTDSSLYQIKIINYTYMYSNMTLDIKQPPNICGYFAVPLEPLYNKNMTHYITHSLMFQNITLHNILNWGGSHDVVYQTSRLSEKMKEYFFMYLFTHHQK